LQPSKAPHFCLALALNALTLGIALAAKERRKLSGSLWTQYWHLIESVATLGSDEYLAEYELE
jgi:hypothetical protein